MHFIQWITNWGDGQSGRASSDFIHLVRIILVEFQSDTKWMYLIVVFAYEFLSTKSRGAFNSDLCPVSSLPIQLRQFTTNYVHASS